MTASTMRAPPSECVARFKELAADAERYASMLSHDDLRDTFLRIARAWNALAAELECAASPALQSANWPNS